LVTTTPLDPEAGRFSVWKVVPARDRQFDIVIRSCPLFMRLSATLEKPNSMFTNPGREILFSEIADWATEILVFSLIVTLRERE
jgi:hypothetical protein